MAKFFPSRDALQNGKQKPDETESQVLSFLNENLNDDFEIFWRPFYNGYEPDIVVIGKNLSVLLLQIKNWKLDEYEIDSADRPNSWRRKGDKPGLVLSPLMQAKIYQDALKECWPDLSGITIRTAVIFPKEDSFKLFRFLNGNELPDELYQSLLMEIKALGNQSFVDGEFFSLVKQFSEIRPAVEDADETCQKMTLALKSDPHDKKQGKPIILSREQAVLIASVKGKRQKIRGVAGCGKTVVLCRRAVNTRKRTQKRVLILTFDPALKRYIRDKINEIEENFDWRDFLIASYEEFFRAVANNYGLKVTDSSSISNIEFFDSVEAALPKYETVLIDEILDYPQEWIDVIAKYFINEDTEFVVFGDEKQNTSDKPLDENKEPVIRKIGGTWNKSLQTVYRYGKEISEIAMKFGEFFLGNKYQRDIVISFNLPLKMGTTAYRYFKSTVSAKLLCDEIFSLTEAKGIKDGQIVILDSGVKKYDRLRDMDLVIRREKKKATMTTIESAEEYAKYKDSPKAVKGIVELRQKRFDCKSSVLKLSTINRFKGLEADTIFLLIENTNENHELIYTGLTRAERNLIIFNLGKKNYDKFFQQMIEDGKLQEL